MLLLGQPSIKEDASVTSLAFSLQGSILIAGHANGDLNIWEFRRVAWECVKSLKDAHTAPIVQVSICLAGSFYLHEDLGLAVCIEKPLLYTSLQDPSVAVLESGNLYLNKYLGRRTWSRLHWDHHYG